MKVTTATELRNNFKEKLDSILDDKEPLLIHRKGEEDMVMISLSDYNAWQETHYLMASKKNRNNLDESIEDFESGKDKGTKIDLDQLWK